MLEPHPVSEPDLIRDGAVNGGQYTRRILLLEDENDRVKICFEKLNMEIKDLLMTKTFEYFRDVTISVRRVPPRLLGVMTPGQLGARWRTSYGALRRRTASAKQWMEQVFWLLPGEVCPGTWVRFAEMDVMNLQTDGEFFSKMFSAGVLKPEEVREFVEALLQ